MSGLLDATLKLVYPADSGTFFTVDTVENGSAFDVVANVEVGKTLRGFGPTFTFTASVINRSKSALLIPPVTQTGVIPATPDTPFNEEVRVSIPGGWSADQDDALTVIGVYRVQQGVNKDQSVSESGFFLVTVP